LSDLRKGLINSLKFLAFFIIGIIFLWLAFRNVEFRKLVDGLKEANYSWVLLSLLFAMMAYISRARRWILLVNPLGYKPSLINTFYSVMTGYLANLALPRIGEITRCVALSRKEKIPVDQLLGTVVIERTIDFFSLLAIMAGLIILREKEIYEFLKASIFIPLREKVFSVLGFTWIIWAVLITLFAITLLLVIRYRKLLRKIHFISKLFDIARGVIDGLKTITNLKNKWEFVFHTIFIWMNYALMTWVVVFALNSFGNSIFLLVIGGLAMSAPVQSGLGAFHYIISRGVAFIAGVNIEEGLVYAFLTHESQLIMVLIIGGLSFFMIFRKHEKDKTVA